MIKILLFVSAFIACINTISAQVVAKFSATECAKEIYRNGFDDETKFAEWTPTVTNAAATWHIDVKPRINGIPEFSVINPTSKNSLAIWYDNSSAAQDESVTSPKIAIPQGAQCSFYACFDGVFIMYANLKIIVTEENGTATTLFDAFLWSQGSGHERPKWIPFNLDLSQFADKKVSFTFSYKGRGGDDVLIDDFVITQPDASAESHAEIKEGETVHFVDLSTGNPTSWEWSFLGADVTTSIEQNPVIKYSKAGTYAVSLKVTDGTTPNTVTREGFVTVKAMAPTAIIGLPAEGYLSPWVATFIPKGVEVTYTDMSLGNPNEWHWQLPGSSSPTSEEQSPKVTYNKDGIYSIAMRATNSAGTDTDIYEKAIQVGGKQNIWNIEMSESSSIAPITLSWYGYYGGTNWLDMPGFGEYFQKPSAPGKISSVDIFFATTKTISPDAEITVAVTSSIKGLPGDILASSKMKVSELKYEEGKYLATNFAFANPVAIENEFFISIVGFPNKSTDTDADAIAMYCSPKRADGGKSTVYNLLSVLDDGNNPTGEVEWVKNSDEFLSFAISPIFEYGQGAGAELIETSKTDCRVIVANEMLQIKTNGELTATEVFSISGQLIHSSSSADNISVSDWGKGIYIVKTIVNGKVSVTKVKI
ncbi:MAG: PKD domain-containing protein [Muribaculaceae bacterium]